MEEKNNSFLQYTKKIAKKTNNHEYLVNHLLKNKGFIIQSDLDFVLNKPHIENLVSDLNEDLITYLLSDKKIEELFFKKIGHSLLFNQSNFLEFLFNTNEYMSNSHTKYENKIGLSNKNGSVILNFPYKDCCLVGGMTALERKNSVEVFFNEVLDKNYIDKLFKPKLFSNIKKHILSEGKISEVVPTEIDLKDNLIIKGNNLIALHTLKRIYKGKIKTIYIDPPYNTGNDSFAYNDKFTHSSWLTFMKNRLEVAKELLTTDGVILVQIDNSPSELDESPELGYLQVLMDEIFKRKNYLTTFSWKKKGNASNTQVGIGTITESILMYAKDLDSVSIELQEYKRKYSHEDLDGNQYNLEVPLKTNSGDYERKTMGYEIVTPEGNFLPPNGKRWTIGETTAKEIVANKKYVIEDGQFKIIKYSNDYKNGDKKLFNNLLLEHGSLKSAKDEIAKYGFNREIFDSPKPEILIKHLLEITTKPSDLVLDFFGGSGTTAAVAMKMNRQVILIEQMDYFDCLTIPRLEKVVAKEKCGIEFDNKNPITFISLYLHSSDVKTNILKSKTVDEVINIIDLNFNKGYFQNVENKEELIGYIKEQNIDIVKKAIIENIFDHNQEYFSTDDILESRLNETEVNINKKFFGIN